ncbi:MAG: glycoside hydrolase family 2 protein [Dysgonamonadaceae bacterium]|jgi:beta-galactosidase|nr:glycoside hydrolase family 2 protein [Dysgonamonadaceae bacterium]
MKNIGLIYLFSLICASLSAQINFPNSTRLNDGWEFVRTDLGSVWEAVRPIAKSDDPENMPIWEKVTLPHTWNAEDAVAPDANYYQGSGWYRNLLRINNPYENGRTVLHFEGAGRATEIYVYTEKVASHTGGYDEWTADITEAVARFRQNPDSKRFNGLVPIEIRCDNSRNSQQIPSNLSDFTIYGGIYRYLNLAYSPSISLSNIYIETEIKKDGQNGAGKINFEINDFLNQKGNISLNIKILDNKNKIVFSKILNTSSSAGKCGVEFEIKNPQFWSPDSPNLYSLIIDCNLMTYKEMFGFRSFEFKEKGAFYLNGKRLLLRGTHRHEDHAGGGAAMTETQIRAEMLQIKAMGANFIRLGHYQQSRIVLDLCDSLGLLVWEEIPWCRGGLGGVEYQNLARQMLENMITQHRNHPSVILWGLGNENDWPNDFPAFNKDSVRIFMQELNDLAHKIDNKRLTSIRRCDFCADIPDVYSPTIWMGWYTGVYKDYRRKTETERAKVSRFFHAEWGGDSHAGRYEETPFYPEYNENGNIVTASKAGDWDENYICDLFDWTLKEQETMPDLSGSAFWTFKDFATPIRPENPVPYVNQKGVAERDGTPKEAYYAVQSYWATEPMLHIFGKKWTTRWGKADEQKIVKVYSNCEKAELFLNGKSLGVKQRNSQDFPAAGLRWNVNFSSGTNILKAVGTKGKTTVADSITLFYETRQFGKPAKIQIKILEETADYAWIEAVLLDENDVQSLEAKDFICFSSSGDGKLVVNQGTASGSSKVEAQNGKGRMKLLKCGGKTIVAVKVEGLETAFVLIN